MTATKDREIDSLTFEERCLLYILSDCYGFDRQITALATAADEVLNKDILEGTINNKTIIQLVRQKTSYSIFDIYSLKRKGYIKSNTLITLDKVYSLTTKGEEYVLKNINRDLEDILQLHFMINQPLSWDCETVLIPRSIRLLVNTGLIKQKDLETDISKFFINPNSLYNAFNIDLNSMTMSWEGNNLLDLDDINNVLGSIKDNRDYILQESLKDKWKIAPNFIEDVFIPYIIDGEFKVPILIPKKKLLKVKQQFGDQILNCLLVEEYLFTYLDLIFEGFNPNSFFTICFFKFIWHHSIFFKLKRYSINTN